ncbi:MAG: hypothetical protein HYU85_01290 [Chloroflexi bacterium]|nr:hypothetical protein [Chloroflexota bacterium]
MATPLEANWLVFDQLQHLEIEANFYSHPVTPATLQSLPKSSPRQGNSTDVFASEYHHRWIPLSKYADGTSQVPTDSPLVAGY